MNDAKISVSRDFVVLDDTENLHIKKVEIFTGDDDYNETDLIEVEATGNKLIAKKNLTENVRPSNLRLRGEPGVRLYIKSECGKDFILQLGHHKGGIILSAKEQL